MKTAKILPMTTNTKTYSDEQEAVFIRFLLLVDTWVATKAGSVLGLDLLIENPLEYWSKSRWELLSRDDVVWLVQACQVPVGERVSVKWDKTSPQAKARIAAKTQHMARRASELLGEHKAQLLHAKT